MAIYDSSKKYRFEVIDKKDSTYQILVEKFFDGSNLDYTWSGWVDAEDHIIHIADTVKRAVEIGNEALSNLTDLKKQ